MTSSARLDTLIEHTVGLKVQRTAMRVSPHNQWRVFLALLMATDVASLALALAATYVIRFYTPISVFADDFILRPVFYLRLSLVLIPVWIGLFWAYGLYDRDNLLGGTREYAAVFQACLAGAIVVAMVQFVRQDLIIARGWVGMSWLMSFMVVASDRFLLRRLAYAARRRGYLMSSALIVGASEEGRLLGDQLQNWPTSGLGVLGFLDDAVPQGTRICRNLYNLGSLDRLEDLVRTYGVEEIILATSGLSRDTILDVFQRYGTSGDVHLRLSSGLFELMTTGLRVKKPAYVPLIGINRVRLTGIDTVIKTLLEYGLSLTALLVLFPAMVLVALLIKLDSPGPVFYRRRVMGLNGRQFHALKFRTMRVDGDTILASSPELLDVLATTHKIKDDPRITRIGFYLRRYSLDELPQLVNVLKGEMSLVGPRIISPPELEKYGQWALNLLTVRPGLTGLWQVSGRSDVSYEERVRLDMFYIRNYSIWLDVQLILQTIPVVFSGRGAY